MSKLSTESAKDAAGKAVAKPAIPAASAEAEVAATIQVETDVSAKANIIDAKTETAIRALQFEDEVGELMKVERISVMATDRVSRYKKFFPSLDTNGSVFAVVCSSPEPDVDDFEHMVVVRESGPEVASVRCPVTMDNYPPSAFVEYRFSASGEWLIGKVVPAVLDHYRTVRYQVWRNMVEETESKAVLRGLLRVGMVTNIWDFNSFPSPPGSASEYSVEKEDGSHVRLPHPVHELRVWDASKGCYRELSPSLRGDAPRNRFEVDGHWRQLLASLRAKHADLSDLLPAKETSVAEAALYGGDDDDDEGEDEVVEEYVQQPDGSYALVSGTKPPAPP